MLSGVRHGEEHLYGGDLERQRPGWKATGLEKLLKRRSKQNPSKLGAHPQKQQ